MVYLKRYGMFEKYPKKTEVTFLTSPNGKDLKSVLRIWG